MLHLTHATDHICVVSKSYFTRRYHDQRMAEIPCVMVTVKLDYLQQLSDRLNIHDPVSLLS